MLAYGSWLGELDAEGTAADVEGDADAAADCEGVIDGDAGGVRDGVPLGDGSEESEGVALADAASAVIAFPRSTAPSVAVPTRIPWPVETLGRCAAAATISDRPCPNRAMVDVNPASTVMLRRPVNNQAHVRAPVGVPAPCGVRVRPRVRDIGVN